jgi:hypothetical protein
MTTENHLLIDNYDTVEVDGWTYRLRVEPDHETTINDYDCYGRYDFGTTGDGWKAVPPASFDLDRTERLTILNDLVWWERPEGFETWTPADQSEMRSLVADLVSFGFSIVFVERLDGEDVYGDAIVVDYDCVGAVDTQSAGIEVASELLDVLKDRAND